MYRTKAKYRQGLQSISHHHLQHIIIIIVVVVVIIIIIIIILHALRLDRPVSASSNSLFKSLPRRLRPCGHNSALFLASCCCSSLLHVVASPICIFSVSRQLLLLSNLPTFFHSLCGPNGCSRLFFGKISSRMTPKVLCPFFSDGPNFAFLFFKISGPKLV